MDQQPPNMENTPPAQSQAQTPSPNPPVLAYAPPQPRQDPPAYIMIAAYPIWVGALGVLIGGGYGLAHSSSTEGRFFSSAVALLAAGLATLEYAAVYKRQPACAWVMALIAASALLSVVLLLVVGLSNHQVIMFEAIMLIPLIACALAHVVWARSIRSR